LQDLAQIGYDATWTMLDSQYFGVPQRRRRVYIVAVRDGIPEGADLFRFVERSEASVKRKTVHLEESRGWNFEQNQERNYPFTYFTRQRSDQFGCKGVASTIMKRDYKDFTDLILDGKGLRKLAVSERLSLQGYDTDYFDDCELSNVESHMLNGMTVPVVKWLGEQIIHFDQSVKDGDTVTSMYEQPFEFDLW
jgi:DNA (cytosine-5)-methyltransferase 1